MDDDYKEAVGAWAKIKACHAAKMKSSDEYRKNYQAVSGRISQEQAKGRERLFKQGGKKLAECRGSIPGFSENESLLRVKTAIQIALLKAREKAGLSQAQLGKILGIPQPNVSRIENASNITLKSFSEYLAACGCTISDIKIVVSG